MVRSCLTISGRTPQPLSLALILVGVLSCLLKAYIAQSGGPGPVPLGFLLRSQWRLVVYLRCKMVDRLLGWSGQRLTRSTRADTSGEILKGFLRLVVALVKGALLRCWHRCYTQFSVRRLGIGAKSLSVVSRMRFARSATAAIRASIVPSCRPCLRNVTCKVAAKSASVSLMSMNLRVGRQIAHSRSFCDARRNILNPKTVSVTTIAVKQNSSPAATRSVRRSRNG